MFIHLFAERKTQISAVTFPPARRKKARHGANRRQQIE